MEHPFFINGGGGGGPRAEALRWLSIAEKLLTNRDLVGSKSFATRARESDPTLIPADQILAIVDTLIAGDKRINNQHLDYYSILQIPTNKTHDSDLIANQYRRLALLLNPQKNSFPYSDHAFRLVLDAWSVLSNAFRRSVYDKEVGFFVNLNPVSVPVSVSVSSPPNNNPMGFMQSSSMMFQSQPQSHPVSSVPSSSRERQTVTFLQDPQTQSMSLSGEQQQQQQRLAFLSRNQTQPPPVVSSTMLSPEREQQQQRPFTFGLNPSRGQQQVASVEQQQQQGNKQQAPQRNEVLIGNIQNHSATSTSNNNVNNEFFFGNNQARSVSTSNNYVNNEGMFGNNQNRSGNTSNNNVNNEGMFGSVQNRSSSTSNINVNNEGLFVNNKKRSASTSNNNVNEGLFISSQNRSASTSNKNVNNEGVCVNSQNCSASTSNKNVNNEGVFVNNQNRSASTSNNNVNGKEGGVAAPKHAIPSFWTACPYCYIMYEYPLDYVDCTLRCQKCKRAFQAVKISSPPPIIEGKEAYFCCWGYMPFGFSMEIFKKNKGNISSWTPFAPIKHAGVSKPAAPRVYIDDIEEDVFLGLSDSSEESDEDWRGVNNKRKKVKSGKGKGKGKSRRGRKKKVKIDQSVKGKNVEVNAGGDNVQDVSATQGGVEVPNVATAQSSKRGVASNTRRQAGRATKDVGKLDLNVEFSNEVEEPPAPGMGQGNEAATGEEGNIEGIEFFEGLDEFLSSLPILNAVGDDKVKAA